MEKQTFIKSSTCMSTCRIEPFLEQAPGPGHDAESDRDREQGEQTREKRREDSSLPKPRERLFHHVKTKEVVV